MTAVPMTQLERLVVESEHAQLTKNRYVGVIREFVAFAGLRPAFWTPDAAQRWKEHLRRRHLAPQTVNVKLNALRYVSRRYSRLNHNNPAFDFAAIIELMPPGPRARRRALSFEDAAALTDACAGDSPWDLRDFAIATLGFRTGMRRFSLCGLTFENVKGNVLTFPIKGRRMHTIPPLDPVALAALSRWMRWLRHRGVSTGNVLRAIRQTIDGEWNISKSLSGQGLYDAMERRAERADVHFTPHIFRHSFVTWMQDLGLPGYLIQAYTGHKSDAMILEYTDAWLRAEREPPTNRLPSAIGRPR